MMQRFGFLEAAMRQNDLAYEVRSFVKNMAEAFPGAVLVFDTANQKAGKLMLKTWLKDAEIKHVGACFAVSYAKSELSEWDKRLTVTSRGYNNL